MSIQLYTGRPIISGPTKYIGTTMNLMHNVCTYVYTINEKVHGTWRNNRKKIITTNEIMHVQWRIKSLSQGGGSKSRKFKWLGRSVLVKMSPPLSKKIMAGGGFPGNQKTPLGYATELC